ncbi:MAG: 4-vinyl reductase [Anaerolineaceae bacterium]|nr:4-vinyl reductase [Anaerolineaceae bacterium]
MQPIPKSGLYIPNSFARWTLIALEEVVGRNGLNAILNLANLSELIENHTPKGYCPPDNLERQFDFADYSAIQGALEELYGPSGGRSLALRAGRVTFNAALRNLGELAGYRDAAVTQIPLLEKLRMGLPALAAVFDEISDARGTVEEQAEQFIYTIDPCPVCWGRVTSKPVCAIAAGMLQEGLKWISGGGDFKVSQISAKSAGDAGCGFLVSKHAG